MAANKKKQWKIIIKTYLIDDSIQISQLLQELEVLLNCSLQILPGLFGHLWDTHSTEYFWELQVTTFLLTV